MQQFDRSDFKRLANQMSKAFRDSHGGGIVERFEAVSKLLFVKIVDERMLAGTWPGPKATQSAMEWRPGENSRVVYERVRAIWQSVTTGKGAAVLQGDRGGFPSDVEAVARIVRLLAGVDLDRVGVDVKGAAYEELLRNTFEKNDNQQYFTPRHLMDFVVAMTDPDPSSIICDPASGSGGFLVGGLTHVAQKYPDQPLPEVHGVDIDERMAWVARINVFLHGGDPTAVAHLSGAGSLRPLSEIQKVLPRNHYSLILTNPPFGSDMTDTAALATFTTGRGRPTRRRGVLFIERCLELLRPGGTLAVIIDDSILNLDGNSDIRAIIRRTAIVDAVVSLPDVTFMPYSTAKSSLLVVTKRDKAHPRTQGPVFMADVENVGNRPNGDPLYQDVPAVEGVRPLLSDLPEVVAAWHEFTATGQVPETEVMTFLADVDEHTHTTGGDRLDVNFFHPTRAVAAATLARASFPTHALEELFDFQRETVSVPEAYGDASVPWIGLGEITAETGEFQAIETPADRIKSAAHPYKPRDILVSRLRPKLRKIVLIGDDETGGVCSAELIVLRKKTNLPFGLAEEYIAYLLRSDLSYGQQVFQITGVGRPRVGVTALRQLRVPVPPEDEQWRILRELNAAFTRYQSLHAQADQLRQQASHLLHDAYASSVDAVTSGVALAWSARKSTAASSSGSDALASS